MNLKSLIHRELAEGLTEKEVASAVGVSVRTITDILADRTPKGSTVWAKLAMYFRTDVDVLRTGISTPPGSREILHPLNRQHGDRALTKRERVYGKVVRLRKNL